MSSKIYSTANRGVYSVITSNKTINSNNFSVSISDYGPHTYTTHTQPFAMPDLDQLTGKKSHIVVSLPNDVDNLTPQNLVNDLQSDYSGLNYTGEANNYFSGLEQTIQGVKLVRDHDTGLRKSGRFKALNERAKSEGWGSLDKPVAYASKPYTSTLNSGVLAFTPALVCDYIIIGAGSNLGKYAQQWEQITGHDKKFFIERSLGEEYYHTIQPKEIKELNLSYGMTELMEAHVRTMLSLHFFKSAQTTNETKAKAAYSTLAKETYKEYLQLLMMHIELYGVKITEEEFKKLTAEGMPAEVVKELARRSTKEPDTKANRYVPRHESENLEEIIEDEESLEISED